MKRKADQNTSAGIANTETPPQQANTAEQSQNRGSMHDDVPIWDDTPCCCEPEPRWSAVEEELEREQPQGGASPEQ